MKAKTTRHLLAVTLVALASSACTDEEDPLEEAGENVEEAVEDAGEEAADEVEDVTDEGG